MALFEVKVYCEFSTIYYFRDVFKTSCWAVSIDQLSGVDMHWENSVIGKLSMLISCTEGVNASIIETHIILSQGCYSNCFVYLLRRYAVIQTI